MQSMLRRAARGAAPGPSSRLPGGVLRHTQAATVASTSPISLSSNSASHDQPSISGRDVRMYARRSPAAKAVPTVDKIEWESPLSVLKYPDPRLRAVNARVGVFDQNLRRLASEMFEVMYQDQGVGLAAPQVGVNIRLMVFNETGVKGKGKEMILVNPSIITASRSTTTEREGCLSFPGIRGDVDRAYAIRVKAQDETGAEVELSLEDWPAVIFQHEYDHLQGVLFHDRMQKPWLEKVRPQLMEMEDAYLAAHPGAAIQRVAPPQPVKVKKGFGS